MSQFISLPILASLRAAEKAEVHEAAHRETYLDAVPAPQPSRVREQASPRKKTTLPS